MCEIHKQNLYLIEISPRLSQFFDFRLLRYSATGRSGAKSGGQGGAEAGAGSTISTSDHDRQRFGGICRLAIPLRLLLLVSAVGPFSSAAASLRGTYITNGVIDTR